MKKNYATYNALMKHIRSKGIEIKGSFQKSRLKNIGYYHGFKGYRFIGRAANQLPFSDFSQLSSVVDFDEELKSIMYGPLMKLETAIKSVTCDAIVTTVKSSNFSDVFQHGFSNEDKRKNYKTRDNVYSSLTKRYQNSVIVSHFYNNDMPIPLWAIFEELMLGDLSNIIEVLDPKIKLQISSSFGIPKGLNTDGAILPKVIQAVKDLRNAVAHNRVIYDGRYIEFKKRDSIKKMLSQETGVVNIKFETMIDDVILVCFLMKNLKFSKEEIRRIPNSIARAMLTLKAKIPNDLYQKVTSGIDSKKIEALKNYISRR